MKPMSIGMNKSTITNSTGKLFVIDNADILLDDNIKKHIVFDDKNQYVIIGRIHYLYFSHWMI